MNIKKIFLIGVFSPLILCSHQEQFHAQWQLMQEQYINLIEQLEKQGYSSSDSFYYHPSWSKIVSATRELILQTADQRYLYKPFISSAMVRFYVEPEVVEFEKRFLLSMSNDDLKHKILDYQEPDTGQLPKECPELNCSKNALGQLFYAATVLEKTGPLESITEFGSGYGCLAHIFKTILPSATIVLIDSPEFLSLQFLYLSLALSQTKIILHQEVPLSCVPGAIHLIPTQFLKDLSLQTDLFISAFALSETPRVVQDMVIEKRFFDAHYCYIVGQLYQYNGTFENHIPLCNAIKKYYNLVIDRPFHIARAQSYEFLGTLITQ